MYDFGYEFGSVCRALGVDRIMAFLIVQVVGSNGNKKYTGKGDPTFNERHDWNSLLTDDARLRFAEYSDDYWPHADDLVRYLRDFAELRKLHIQYSTRVDQIESKGRGFVLGLTHLNGTKEEEKANTGSSLHCLRVVMATGVSPAVPDIPGIDLAIGYEEVNTAKNAYANKSILILGGGNSALETARQV